MNGISPLGLTGFDTLLVRFPASNTQTTAKDRVNVKLLHGGGHRFNFLNNP